MLMLPAMPPPKAGATPFRGLRTRSSGRFSSMSMTWMPIGEFWNSTSRSGMLAWSIRTDR